MLPKGLRQAPCVHYDPSMPRLRARAAIVVALIAVTGAGSFAQRFGVFEGAGAGIRDFGMYATDSLRLEKCYRAWKVDLSHEFTPLEASLDRFRIRA